MIKLFLSGILGAMLMLVLISYKFESKEKMIIQSTKPKIRRNRKRGKKGYDNIKEYFKLQEEYKGETITMDDSCNAKFNLPTTYKGKYHVFCNVYFKDIDPGSYVIFDDGINIQWAMKHLNCGHANIKTKCNNLHAVAWVDGVAILEKGLGPSAYNHMSDDPFYDIAMKTPTDKVHIHSYHHSYSKYLPLKRNTSAQVFEVGLGCDMKYGPGASAKIWKEYFRNAEIHFLEFDGDCVKNWEKEIEDMDVNVHVGDQADVCNFYFAAKKSLKQELCFLRDENTQKNMNANL